MSTKVEQPKRLRWFQIRLRTFVIGVTVITVLLALLGYYVRPYLQQKSAIARIRSVGGIVETRPGPEWLSTVLGEDNCRSIVVVNLADIDPDEELLAIVSTLPEVEVLILGGDSITDESLRHVPRCDSLTSLILDSTRVTPEAMSSLRQERAGLYVSNCDRLLLEQALSQLFMVSSPTERVSPDAAPDPYQRIAPEFVMEVTGFDGVFTHDLTLEDVALWRRFRHLESIRLVGEFSVAFDYDSMQRGAHRPNITNHKEIIRAIVTLPNLRELEIGFRDLDWAKGLSPIENMESLSFSTDTDEAYFLTDDDVSQLLTLFPNLKELALDDAAVTSPGKWPQAP